MRSLDNAVRMNFLGKNSCLGFRVVGHLELTPRILQSPMIYVPLPLIFILYLHFGELFSFCIGLNEILRLRG